MEQIFSYLLLFFCKQLFLFCFGNEVVSILGFMFPVWMTVSNDVWETPDTVSPDNDWIWYWIHCWFVTVLHKKSTWPQVSTTFWMVTTVIRSFSDVSGVLKSRRRKLRTQPRIPSRYSIFDDPTNAQTFCNKNQPQTQGTCFVIFQRREQKPLIRSRLSQDDPDSA